MTETVAAPLRFCLDCRQEAYDFVDLELFVNDKGSNYGKANLCTKCHKERGKKYRAVNSEKEKERHHKYYIENYEALNEKSREWYKANPERYGESRRKWREANPFRIRLIKLKGRSKQKGVAFDLDLEYLEQLWNECVGICSKTGISLLKKSDRINPFVMSVDRIIPEKGYVKGNVRLISNWYNLTRRNWGDEFTLEMCQRVVEHSRREAWK